MMARLTRSIDSFTAAWARPTTVECSSPCLETSTSTSQRSGSIPTKTKEWIRASIAGGSITRVDTKRQSCTLLVMRAIKLITGLLLAMGICGCAADPSPPQAGAAPIRALLITGGHEHDIAFYSIFDGYKDAVKITVSSSNIA